MICHLHTLGLRNILPPRSISSTSRVLIGHWNTILNGLLKNSIAQYSGINTVLHSSQKDLLVIKGNRLGIFEASLQCTGEAKVVSRRTPWSWTSVTWGIWWLVSAAEKNGESGGMIEKNHNVVL